MGDFIFFFLKFILVYIFQWGKNSCLVGFMKRRKRRNLVLEGFPALGPLLPCW